MKISVKRAYEKPSSDDGWRVLVDRLWPRGVRKQDVKIDRWLKDLAPSNEIREWFGHDPAKWEEFKTRYFLELDGKLEAVSELATIAKERKVTLIYAAKDDKINNATALQSYIETRFSL